LLAVAGIILLAGIAVALLAFPARSGCLDGEGAISPGIPLYLCSGRHALLPKGVDNTGLASRVSIIGIAVIVGSMLVWAAFDDPAKRPYVAAQRPDQPAGSSPVRWKR
jgi:hypothetical protein